jgi:hypothetical protein
MVAKLLIMAVPTLLPQVNVDDNAHPCGGGAHKLSYFLEKKCLYNIGWHLFFENWACSIGSYAVSRQCCTSISQFDDHISSQNGHNSLHKSYIIIIIQNPKPIPELKQNLLIWRTGPLNGSGMKTWIEIFENGRRENGGSNWQLHIGLPASFG